MGGKNLHGMLENLSARLDKALAASDLIAGLKLLAQTDRRLKSGRPLSDDERLRLQSQGNLCADWSRVRLESETGLESIRDNRFAGDILIAGFHGACPGPDGRSRPAGMAYCNVLDAIIGNACLHQITRLERQVIADGAILVGLGDLACPAPTLFSLGSAIHPGSEEGTRSAWIWDPLTLDDCVHALSLTAEAQKTFQQKIAAALAPLRSAFGYVGAGASVLHTPSIQSAYIGPGTSIAGASSIREAALLSTAGERCVVAEAGWIERSLLQPGARVESGGKVSNSVLLEHASVAWGGMVSQSIVGPHTHVHKGEMTASLVGPFVGFHHQSLLISALWPEGRGNIAYGANVGSNHTGKKPDQEIRPGEGNFFGLGCSIKFPANFEDAPYSLIATGVSTLPQRLAFPFSLINQPLAGFPELAPALNEIVPGWMWSDNAYSLVRRSYKFASATQARHQDFEPDESSAWKTGFFAGRIFTTSVAQKALQACKALQSPATSTRPYYLENDIPGLGKNVLRRETRDRALAAYQDYLAFFLMRTYADRPQANWDAELTGLIAAIGEQLALGTDAKTFLAAQRPRLAAFRESILASLDREDKRGRRIFDDYADFHAPPESDRTLLRLDKDLSELNQKLDAYLNS